MSSQADAPGCSLLSRGDLAAALAAAGELPDPQQHAAPAATEFVGGGDLACRSAAASTPWALLPARELGCGSATTCWRRWTRLGRYRWTIERTGAWLGGWRRLRIRYERGSERFSALVLVACSVICFRPATTTVLTTTVWSVPLPAGYGCQRVTQTTKRRLLPW